jgi:NAD(P)-dependent dehydrogenase (short-subunit alcohol dehydrogenase family)
MTAVAVTVVTGGTRGLGRAIAGRRIRAGGHVALIYSRDHEEAERTRAALTADGGSVSVHAGDVSSASAMDEIITAVEGEHGPVGYLVNNAGTMSEIRFSELGADDWSRSVDINLGAPFHLAQRVWTGMVERGFGRIVNVSSVTAVMGNPRQVHYAAAKAGLIGMTRALARAGARHGVTVNCLVPGVFDTDMTAGMSERSRTGIAALIPVGRIGAPDEFAHAVEFLLADAAAFVTGAVIPVDGGISMGL